MDETPPPAAPTPEPAPNPPSPESGGSGLAPNIAAGVAALLPPVTGFVFLALEKKDPFVRVWAMQSVFFGCVALAFQIVMEVLGKILIHIPILGRVVAVLLGLVGMVVGLGFLILWIITLVKAFCNSTRMGVELVKTTE